MNTCNGSKAGNQFELNQPFQLKFQEAGLLKSSDFMVRFNSLVQESRCPKDVTCITAGKAVIELQLAEKEREKPISVELSTETGSNEITQKEYKIKLVDVTPYPISTEKNEENRYVVTLIVSRL